MPKSGLNRSKDMTEEAIPYIDTQRRHDFTLLFDVIDGNPNGDPDAGNQPRMDMETMQGLVTDVAIKRKVRDFVDMSLGGESAYKIYIQSESYLTETRERVFVARDNGSPDPKVARQWMCEEFFDVRMFGAVMSMTQNNAGQVRGPVQFTFARSIDSILPMNATITRVALERRGDAASEAEDENSAPTHGTIGNKNIVPYGLYRCHGFFNPHFAQQTGVSPNDMEILWSALVNMWDVDRSAARGFMSCRGLYIFSHDSKLGNAPAHRLFDKIAISKNDDVSAPRQFSDYTVTVDEDMPKGITFSVLEG